MKRFDILTLFPEMTSPYTEGSILGRAQKKKKIKITSHNIRDFATGKHKQVDDTPYGGGPGMVMMVEPIEKAVRKVTKKLKKTRVIVTSAKGRTFDQHDAKRLAKYDQLIFICGRYEGIDQRVIDEIADEELSIGNYVLTGGELPALVMTDAIARMIPGVLGNEKTLHEESHSTEGYLEYPQYTKPEVFKMRKGLKKNELTVPSILLSGDHKKIESWRKSQSKTQ